MTKRKQPSCVQCLVCCESVESHKKIKSTNTVSSRSAGQRDKNKVQEIFERFCSLLKLVPTDLSSWNLEWEESLAFCVTCTKGIQQLIRIEDKFYQIQKELEDGIQGVRMTLRKSAREEVSNAGDLQERVKGFRKQLLGAPSKTQPNLQSSERAIIGSVSPHKRRCTSNKASPSKMYCNDVPDVERFEEVIMEQDQYPSPSPVDLENRESNSMPMIEDESCDSPMGSIRNLSDDADSSENDDSYEVTEDSDDSDLDYRPKKKRNDKEKKKSAGIGTKGSLSNATRSTSRKSKSSTSYGVKIKGVRKRLTKSNSRSKSKIQKRDRSIEEFAPVETILGGRMFYEGIEIFKHSDRYSCGKCGYNKVLGVTSLEMRKMKIHIKGIHFDAYKCETCDKKFSSRDILNSHIKKVHTLGSTPCNICQRPISGTTRSMENHMWSHKNAEEKAEATKRGEKPVDIGKAKLREKRHSCSTCGKLFDKPFQLRRHENTHLNLETKKCLGIVCPYCNKFFSSELSKKLHVRNTHEKYSSNRYQTTKSRSSVTYNKDGSLRKSKIKFNAFETEVDGKLKYEGHQVSRLDDGFQCGTCGLEFKDGTGTYKQSPDRAIREHIHAIHLGAYTCNHCEKICKSSRDLGSHKYKYHYNREEECKICGATVEKANRRQHRWLHMNVEEMVALMNAGDRMPSSYRQLKNTLGRIVDHDVTLNCIDCTATFHSVCELDEHRTAQHIEKIKQCYRPDNNKSLKSSTDYRQNIIQKTSTTRKLIAKSLAINNKSRSRRKNYCSIVKTHKLIVVQNESTVDSSTLSPPQGLTKKIIKKMYRKDGTLRKSHVKFGEFQTDEDGNLKYEGHGISKLVDNGFLCIKCGLEFKAGASRDPPDRAIREHIHAIHLGAYACEHCRKWCKSSRDLGSHKYKFHYDQQEECQICKETVYKTRLRLHHWLHHMNIEEMTSLINSGERMPSSYRKLKNTLARVVDPDVNLACIDCTETFHSVFELDNHRTTKHMDKIKFIYLPNESKILKSSEYNQRKPAQTTTLKKSKTAISSKKKSIKNNPVKVLKLGKDKEEHRDIGQQEINIVQTPILDHEGIEKRCRKILLKKVDKQRTIKHINIMKVGCRPNNSKLNTLPADITHPEQKSSKKSKTTPKKFIVMVTTANGNTIFTTATSDAPEPAENSVTPGTSTTLRKRFTSRNLEIQKQPFTLNEDDSDTRQNKDLPSVTINRLPVSVLHGKDFKIINDHSIAYKSPGGLTKLYSHHENNKL